MGNIIAIVGRLMLENQHYLITYTRDAIVDSVGRLQGTGIMEKLE